VKLSVQGTATPKVWLAYAASLALQTWLVSFLDNAGRVLAGAFFLEILVRLFLIEGMYRVYHTTKSERVKETLHRIARPPVSEQIFDGGSNASLLGNLVVLGVFYWPFAVYAMGALASEAGWVVAITTALTLRQVLAGGIHLDFSRSKPQNFGYNMMWIFTVLLIIVLGVVVMLAASLANGFDLIPPGKGAATAQVLIAFTILAAQHVVDLLINFQMPQRTSRATPHRG
jgi:magnesium-transporting ATPase (P-type)